MGARVLVADDSAVNREVAQEALSRLGVEVRCVNDGREAVDAVFAEHFDLVLMDGSMPELDGYDATREIRAREATAVRPKTPVVALTAPRGRIGGGRLARRRQWTTSCTSPSPWRPWLGNSGCSCSRARRGRSRRRLRLSHPFLRTPLKPMPALYGGEPLIDEEVAGQLAAMAAAGRTEFVDRVHGLYRDNAPQSAVKLAEAVRAGDADAAAKAAHALKSMSYNVGGACSGAHGWRHGSLRPRGAAPPAPQAVEELARVLERTFAAIAAGAGRDGSDPAFERDSVAQGRPNCCVT